MEELTLKQLQEKIDRAMHGLEIEGNTSELAELQEWFIAKTNEIEQELWALYKVAAA